MPEPNKKTRTYKEWGKTGQTPEQEFFRLTKPINEDSEDTETEK